MNKVAQKERNLEIDIGLCSINHKLFFWDNTHDGLQVVAAHKGTIAGDEGGEW